MRLVVARPFVIPIWAILMTTSSFQGDPLKTQRKAPLIPPWMEKITRQLVGVKWILCIHSASWVLNRGSRKNMEKYPSPGGLLLGKPNTVDGRNPAPPEKSWSDAPAVANGQSLPLAA